VESNGEYEIPTGWSTNQTAGFGRLSKDTDAVEGSYSLKLFPSTISAFQGCQSRLETSILLDPEEENPLELSFWAKSILDEINYTGLVFFFMKVNFYLHGGFVETDQLFFQIPFEEYERIVWEFQAVKADSMVLFIIGGAGAGATDGCFSRSITWIDDLRLQYVGTNSVKKEDYNAQVRVYPIPSSGILNIQSPYEKFETFELIDMMGRRVESGKIEEGRITTFYRGVFNLRLISAKTSVVRKVVFE
jgi:hypothetical protein